VQRGEVRNLELCAAYHTAWRTPVISRVSRLGHWRTTVRRRLVYRAILPITRHRHRLLYFFFCVIGILVTTKTRQQSSPRPRIQSCVFRFDLYQDRGFRYFGESSHGYHHSPPRFSFQWALIHYSWHDLGETSFCALFRSYSTKNQTPRTVIQGYYLGCHPISIHCPRIGSDGLDRPAHLRRGG